MGQQIAEDSILLIGNIEESFYQLGQKDREHWSGQLVHPLKVVADKLSTLSAHWSEQGRSILQAYADGANISLEALKASVIQKELTFSSFGPANLLLQSSPQFFQVIGRDLSGNNVSALSFCAGTSKYTPHTLRHIQYAFSEKENSAMAISPFIGPFAYPVFVKKNGLVVSMQMLPSSKLNLKKSSALDLFTRLIIEADSIKESLKLIRETELIIPANFLIYESQNEVATQLSGGQGVWKKQEWPLNPGQSFYLPKTWPETTQHFPLSESLEQEIQNEWKNKSKGKLKKSDDLITSLLPKNPKTFGPGSAKFFLNILIKPNETEILHQFSHDQIITTHQLGHQLSNSKRKIPKGKMVDDLRLHWMNAQEYYVLKNEELAYHHLQLAITLAEGEEKNLLEFFFILWQYLKTTGKKELSFLYKELLALYPNLPDAYQDHALIFIQRLQIQLSLVSDDLSHSFQNSELAQRFSKEKKLGKALIPLANKLTWPRLDLGDIGYFL